LCCCCCCSRLGDAHLPEHGHHLLPEAELLEVLGGLDPLPLPCCELRSAALKAGLRTPGDEASMRWRRWRRSRRSSCRGGGAGVEVGPRVGAAVERAARRRRSRKGDGRERRRQRPAAAAPAIAMGDPRRPGTRDGERDLEKRRKKMTYGACVSVTGEMKYTSSYTPAAGPRLCPYVFSGIFVGTEEL